MRASRIPTQSNVFLMMTSYVLNELIPVAPAERVMFHGSLRWFLVGVWRLFIIYRR
jgi:hypothetical protein